MSHDPGLSMLGFMHAPHQWPLPMHALQSIMTATPCAYAWHQVHPASVPQLHPPDVHTVPPFPPIVGLSLPVSPHSHNLRLRCAVVRRPFPAVRCPSPAMRCTVLALACITLPLSCSVLVQDYQWSSALCRPLSPLCWSSCVVCAALPHLTPCNWGCFHCNALAAHPDLRSPRPDHRGTV